MARVAAIAAAGLLLIAPSAMAAGNAGVAALQVALRTKGVYSGTIDGVPGKRTTAAVVAFQRSRRLVPDGIVGPATRRALGRRWSRELGRRILAFGAAGSDVAELQFALAWHGFPSGPFDGVFGPHVLAAVTRFQRYAGLPVLGVTGPRTIAALRAPMPESPITLAWPLRAAVGSLFGPRGNRFHAGIDLPARAGALVAAAGQGYVAWAGPADGYGNLVVIAHGHGVRSFYAHLSRIDVRLGRRVDQGDLVGLVGSTGEASGPHLHFEVRDRGAAVDPLGVLR